MIQTRELTDNSEFTCDWGHCDVEAIAERLNDDGAWLSVCPRHAGRIPRRSSPGRAVCPCCENDYALTINGNLPLHRHGWATCAGSRTNPVEAP